MSWIAPVASNDRTNPQRMVYYFRAVKNTITKSFAVNDQLPLGGLLRITCSGAVGCPTATPAIPTVWEVRLSGAFSPSRIYDADQATTLLTPNPANQAYILLGHIVHLGPNNTSKTCVFKPATTVCAHAMNGSIWTIQIVDVNTGTVATTGTWFGAWGFQLDVRAQGYPDYTD